MADVGMRRADDRQILERAISESRVLVTLDEHFGNWAVLPLEKHPGVIRLKVDPTTSDNVLALLLPFLASHPSADYANRLVIVRESGVRWINTGP